MKFLKITALVGALTLLAWGQSGTIKSDGQPIPGATVRATQGDRVLTTLTDANGNFTLDNMGPGMWTIDVSMFGFDTAHKEIQVGASPVKIDLNLQLRELRGGFGRGGGGFGGAAGQRGGFGGGAGQGGFARGGGFGRGGGNGGAGNPPGAAANAGGAAPNGASGGASGAGQNAAGGNRNTNQSGFDQDALAAAAAEAQAGVQAEGGIAGETPQVAAEGANESFLVNGSISTGLNTQAGDFQPGGQFGGGAANAGSANLPPGVDRGTAGAGVQAATPGIQGPVIIGGPGGGGPPGGGFGGGGFGGGGGRGGGGGFAVRGGRGPGRGNGAFIGNRRNAGRSQIRGSIFYTLGDSVFDASPFSINGQGNTKAPFTQNKFGFTVGGPLEIPKLFKSENTFFFINYTGNLQKVGQDLIGTVPTLAERSGDFSAISSLIYDPITGVPFTNNQIPVGRINPIAQGLLAYIPLPNQPGTINNYRFVTATPNNSQALNMRVLQTLSRTDQLGFGVNWQGRNALNPQLYGFTDTTNGNGINANTNWRHTIAPGLFNNIVGTFNRNSNSTVPYFANGTNVAAELGIQGTSSNPLNYGPPNLSFTNFGSLTDASPTQSAIYNFGFTDTLQWRKGKHNWSFGGGYNRYFNNTVTDANGRGTFTFTGLTTSLLNSSGQPVSGTGFDFADFLLGAPQSDSIRYGSSNTYFRSDSYAAFAQDDWRLLPNLTLNLGLRYEFFSPWWEKYGRIANLDIAPDFTAVSVVTPGEVGLYSGMTYPSGLIKPDRHDFGPRTGLAWKPTVKSPIVVRLGYGIYYNPSQYNKFESQLSAQPPFAQSTTVTTSLTSPLTLAQGFTVTPAGKTILNTYAVDPNYNDMYAQSWTVSVQSNLPGSQVGELAYIGTKGTNLDVLVQPNTAPPGSPLTSEERLSIGNATGFTYDEPVGNSIYNAFQARLARRFRRGFSYTLLYTFSKAIDDSSTLGGAGNTVAQNFNDISAERGLSSFDRRHVFTPTFIWQPPIGGTSSFLANHTKILDVLKDWTITGSGTFETGLPLTARVLGNLSDTAGTGNVGSGRAEATGLPVTDGSGFFNLAAFTVPAAGAYGNAGRNTIPGPGTISMNLSLQRTIPLTERMRLQFRVDTTNITNHVNYTTIGTVVNSLTYGVPTAASGMRNVTFTARFNF